MSMEPVQILTDNGQQSSINCHRHETGDDESTPNSNCDDVVSLVTAINGKYCSEQSTALPLDSTIFMKPIVHLPGKRRASGSLELLVLNEQQISVAGDLCQLSPMVRNITELDLAFNQLSSWREVFTMLSQMPHLVHANLSQNPLNESLTEDDDWLKSILSNSSVENDNEKTSMMPKLSNLVLNATGIQWGSLFTILDLMPNLEELHLSLNDYSNLSGVDGEVLGNSATTSRTFPHVHNLHINHCQLKSWRALLTICRLFPCLETLVAAGNPIPNIGDNEKDVDAELIEYFGCLHTLNANYWPLTNWDDVDRIRKFPLLSELRINHVTLLQPFNEMDRRHLLIARLPDITLLNGSPVTLEQRENAERFFLRCFLDNEKKPDRYFELESVHGLLMPLADIDLSPKDCADVVLVMDERRENRRISLNQSVGELKKSLLTFCNMPPGRFRVFFRRASAGEEYFENELRFPKIMLHSLTIEDGDEFCIFAKPDPPARRRTSSSNSTPCTASSPSKVGSTNCTSCSEAGGGGGGSPVKR